MITKIKAVFYCEYCGKHGLRGDAIEKHEKHCTVNPHRKCRVCDDYPDKVVRVKVSKPVGTKWGIGRSFSGEEVERYKQDINSQLADCPACALAQIRQSDVDCGMLGFDYKEEIKKWWQAQEDQFNQEY